MGIPWPDAVLVSPKATTRIRGDHHARPNMEQPSLAMASSSEALSAEQAVCASWGPRTRLENQRVQDRIPRSVGDDPAPDATGWQSKWQSRTSDRDHRGRTKRRTALGGFRLKSESFGKSRGTRASRRGRARGHPLATRPVV